MVGEHGDTGPSTTAALARRTVASAFKSSRFHRGRRHRPYRNVATFGTVQFFKWPSAAVVLDEEDALNRYNGNLHLNHERLLNHEHLGRNGVLARVVKSAVLRDIAEGVVPDRQNMTGTGRHEPAERPLLPRSAAPVHTPNGARANEGTYRISPSRRDKRNEVVSFVSDRTGQRARMVP